ncbi:hypothetical protein ACO2Q3_11460 [Caulobacter sp. KR2-114]|uniref:hypothetical protein n=1 Tax=Caulobacter sp. KR2-114 TaxID=3400912 RepID=UPI003BFD6B7C
MIAAVKVADMREFLTDAGATVDKVEVTKDGFHITASLGRERHVWVEGMDCKGDGEAQACPEFSISARWTLESAARATAAARDISFAYTTVNTDGRNIELSRMDFIPDGVTRNHVRSAVAEFIELRSAAENAIWPPAKSTRPPKTPAK